MEGRLLDEYSSKEDFVDAVVASCYIPYYLGPAPGIRYRGELCSDGLPTNFFPEIVDSAKDKVQKTVMVSYILQKHCPTNVVIIAAMSGLDQATCRASIELFEAKT